MLDAFDAIGKMIQSPPGQLVAGATLGGVVWKFLERVDAVLNADTKLKIAVWLLDRGSKGSEAVQRLVGLLSGIADIFFGEPLRFWLMMTLITTISTCFLLGAVQHYSLPPTLWVIGVHSVATACIAYLTYSALWYSLSMIESYIKSSGYEPLDTEKAALAVLLIAGIPAAIVFLGSCAVFIGYLVFHHNSGSPVPRLLALSSLIVGTVSTMPFFLFISSIFLLKVITPFALGFAWFNRHLDIEKHPLQSIGLVSGCIVAMAYWTAAAIHRLI